MKEAQMAILRLLLHKFDELTINLRLL